MLLLYFKGYELNEVILVGGATRMPAVQKIIERVIGKKYNFFTWKNIS